MSRQLTDDEVRLAARLLSSERLSAFVRITGTDRDAIELHNHAMMFAATLMPIIGMIEVVLRNAVCERLNLTFAHPDWLNNPSRAFKWKGAEADVIQTAARAAQRAAYSKLTQVEKRNLDNIAFPAGLTGISHKKRSKGRQKVITISKAQHIAQLTLFFWKRLLSRDYEETLWKQSLKRLFPNKALSRGQIANHLEVIYQTRNRIAHHEPIMGARCSRALSAVEFLALNFNAKTSSEDGILAKMTAPYRTTLAQEAAALDAILTKVRGNPRN
jgi:hypothetical protein